MSLLVALGGVLFLALGVLVVGKRISAKSFLAIVALFCLTMILLFGLFHVTGHGRRIIAPVMLVAALGFVFYVFFVILRPMLARQNQRERDI